MNPESREHQPEFHIRLATPGDAAEIARIQHESWLETYPSEELNITKEDILAFLGLQERRVNQWKNQIEVLPETMRVFIIEEDGHVRGYCRVSRFKNENHIDAMYVDPRAKGTGAGGKVFKESLDWLGDEKDIALEVAAHNDHAIGFYEKFGFELDGEDKSIGAPSEGSRAKRKTPFMGVFYVILVTGRCGIVSRVALFLGAS